MSSRAQFRVRLGATRRGGSGESIQGLRAVVRRLLGRHSRWGGRHKVGERREVLRLGIKEKEAGEILLTT
jgi:hypothetical protein